MQREYVTLSLAEKLTILLTALVVWGVIMLVLLLCVIFASLAVSSWIADLVDSEPLGYAVVALVYVLVCVLVYANRQRWIGNPIANFLAATLFSDDDKNAQGEDKCL